MFLHRLLEPGGRLFYEFDVRDRAPFETGELVGYEKTPLRFVE